jgi:ATP-dependent RNA helicase DeaD
MEKLLQVVEEGNIEQYMSAAEALLTKADSAALVAAALKIMTKEPDATPVLITEEAPLRRPRTGQKPFGRPRAETNGRERRQGDHRARQARDKHR